MIYTSGNDLDYLIKFKKTLAESMSHLNKYINDKPNSKNKVKTKQKKILSNIITQIDSNQAKLVLLIVLMI